MNKKIIVIIATFLIVSGIVFIFIPQYIKMLDKNTVKAYFTNQNIAKGTMITKNMVTIKDINIKGLDFGSGGVIKAKDDKDFEKVENQFAEYDMVAGEIVMRSKLTDIGIADAGYMYRLEKDYYAYPVRTDLESTGAGILQPGDYIDLYMTVKDRNIGDTDGFERTSAGYVGSSKLLSMLEILDLRNQSGSIGYTGGRKWGTMTGNQDKTPRVLILKLTGAQIKELMKFESLGCTTKIAFRTRNADFLKQINDAQTQYTTVPEFEYQDFGNDRNDEVTIN